MYNYRKELQELLRRQAILYSTPSAPITHRNGDISPWAFYSWGITLTNEGLRLAARNLLEVLETFNTTQIASYGYTGLPLLSACVLEGGGKYTGLSIREKRKPHLTNRRIDGNVDRTKSVVVVDDSLSSGTSLHKAITALEEDGLEVEGTVALVHFPARGAKQWANASGYRTVTLFDIWTDLGMADIDPPYTGYQRQRGLLSTEQMPDGLPPAELARRVAEFYLGTGQIPQWPRNLDDNYDARGGTFVSFRERSNDHRVARDGFWHFDPTDAEPARDVVLATIDTLGRASYDLTLAALRDLKICVTFFGPLEQIPPSKLDFDRYGIVARSNVWPGKLGGALPNTQVFISDIEQYRHARKTNAQIADDEPHTLYRHTITKVVEKGETWLPYGCEETAENSWWRSREIGKSLTERAWSAIENVDSKRSLQGSVLPIQHEAIAVTLYSHGLCGYGMSYDPDLDTAVVAAAQSAWKDPRNVRNQAVDRSNFSLVVAVLHTGEAIEGGRLLIEKKIRRGLDAVSLLQDGRRFTILPSALVYNDWTRQQLLDALERIAGGVRPQHSWRTHQVASWVAERGGVHPLKFGFPWRDACVSDVERSASAIEQMASYIHRSIGPHGLPAYRLTPNDDDYVREGTAARVLHGLYSLRIAGDSYGRRDWQESAADGVGVCLQHVAYGSIDLPRHIGGALADTILLAAASVCGFAKTQLASDVANKVAGYVHDSGWIGAGTKRLDNPQDQEFLPGAVIWALALYCRSTNSPLPMNVSAARRFYGHRFREHPTWGCSWLAQGWGAVHDLTNDPDDAQIAFAAADWVISQQLEKSGAFLEDMSRDEPSFNTGFIAEGLAGAWRAAVAQNDHERARRYEQAWCKALGFVETLTLRGSDVFPFAVREAAVGGVRCTLSRASIRIDQVSHSLHALVEGHQLLTATRKLGVHA
jgi:orotate phosphoribosyltransferase/AMMECR1 domain-containing protein